MEHRYFSVELADFFVHTGLKVGKLCTPMKLNKLVYISHGWSLGLRHKPLVVDEIQAWKYGPVLPLLYNALSSYGRSPVDRPISEEEPTVHNEEAKAFLEDVWDKYGDFTAAQLSNMTHRKGSPWDQVYRKGIRGIRIPDAIIEKYYKALYEQHTRDTNPG